MKLTKSDLFCILLFVFILIFVISLKIKYKYLGGQDSNHIWNTYLSRNLIPILKNIHNDNQKQQLLLNIQNYNNVYKITDINILNKYKLYTKEQLGINNYQFEIYKQILEILTPQYYKQGLHEYWIVFINKELPQNSNNRKFSKLYHVNNINDKINYINNIKQLKNIYPLVPTPLLQQKLYSIKYGNSDLTDLQKSTIIESIEYLIY